MSRALALFLWGLSLTSMNAYSLSYARHWRWHRDMGYWLTKDPRADATEKSATYERGTYIFFDPTIWQRVEQKDFELLYSALEDRSQHHQQQQHQQLAQVVAGGNTVGAGGFGQR